MQGTFAAAGDLGVSACNSEQLQQGICGVLSLKLVTAAAGNVWGLSLELVTAAAGNVWGFSLPPDNSCSSKGCLGFQLVTQNRSNSRG